MTAVVQDALLAGIITDGDLRRQITSIIVTAPGGAVDGVVHLHDLWQTELF